MDALCSFWDGLLRLESFFFSTWFVWWGPRGNCFSSLSPLKVWNLSRSHVFYHMWLFLADSGQILTLHLFRPLTLSRSFMSMRQVVCLVTINSAADTFLNSQTFLQFILFNRLLFRFSVWVVISPWGKFQRWVVANVPCC